MDVGIETGYSLGLIAVSLFPFFLGLPAASASQCARSSMDRVLPSEGRGCWFDPSRARHPQDSRRSP
ncbi:hypothetical protein PSAC2689_40056 [Paraburkholderia sacchari]